MSDVYIFRQKLKVNYVVIRNSLARDKRLTFEARGLLLYLLSQPPNWEVNKDDLINQSPSAKNYAVARILKELERVKYIFRKKYQNEKGHWKWITYVFDEPYTERDMNEIDKEMAEILGPEIMARTKAIKENAEARKPSKEKLLAAAAGIGEKDHLEGYPVHVKDLLAEFVSVSEIKPTKSKKAFWIKTATEWREIGIKPENIKQMYEYAVENFGGVAKPTGITSAFHMMRTAKKPETRGLRVAE